MILYLGMAFKVKASKGFAASISYLLDLRLLKDVPAKGKVPTKKHLDIHIETYLMYRAG